MDNNPKLNKTGIQLLLSHAERFAEMLPPNIDKCIDSAVIHLERSDQCANKREQNELAAFQSFVASRLESHFNQDERINFSLGASNQAGGIWVSRVDIKIDEVKALEQGFSLDDIDMADAVLSQVCLQITSSLNDEVVREAEPLFDLNKQCLKPGKGLPLNDRMQAYLIDIGLLALCREDEQGGWVMTEVVALSDHFDTQPNKETLDNLVDVRELSDLIDVKKDNQEQLNQAYTRSRIVNSSFEI